MNRVRKTINLIKKEMAVSNGAVILLLLMMVALSLYFIWNQEKLVLTRFFRFWMILGFFNAYIVPKMIVGQEDNERTWMSMKCLPIDNKIIFEAKLIFSTITVISLLLPPLVISAMFGISPFLGHSFVEVVHDVFLLILFSLASCSLQINFGQHVIFLAFQGALIAMALFILFRKKTWLLACLRSIESLHSRSGDVIACFVFAAIIVFGAILFDKRRMYWKCR